MPHDHTALLARLCDAKEGSRELGDAVLFAAGWRNDVRGWAVNPVGKSVCLWGQNAPDPTTSLDAITREIEARMWWWMTSSTGKSFVIGDCLDPESAFYAECATPVLSLCYAFVEALSHE